VDKKLAQAFWTSPHVCSASRIAIDTLIDLAALKHHRYERSMGVPGEIAGLFQPMLFRVIVSHVLHSTLIGQIRPMQ
jgi:hypothetical protein